MNSKTFAAVAVLVLLSQSPIAASAAEPPAAHVNPAVTVQYNVMVPMRDGVRLSTDIYRPAKEGRYPVILVRNMYSNGSDGFLDMVSRAHRWAENGYVFLHQDVRGRYDSEGEFYPYIHEAQDGYDAQQWAGSQPWSSGTVGLWGPSYLASVQWFSAPLRSRSLTALAPLFTPFNYYQDVAYVGGALSLASRISWAAANSSRTNQTPPRDWARVLRHLPLQTMDEALGADLPPWRDWIAHASYDAYWKALNMESRLGEMDVPSYNVGGWYDVFVRGTLVSYVGMRHQARSERARKGQKLIIGPWQHASYTARLGDLDFGQEAALDMDALYQRWFDHWLKEKDTGFLDEPPIRLFVMGENRWRFENEWPLARTRYTHYYFHSGGRANGSRGEGQLDLKKPGGAQPPDQYVYDPEDPVPTLGGTLMFAGTPAGPYDQTSLSQRGDILVYASRPLATDVEVTGPVSVILYAASSAPDTDFTAKLIDVHPDGKAYNLADGIIRARYRQSFEQPQLLKAGQVYEYTIDLWATSNLFKKGHRIRVDISSSNFPRFDRNPNTGHDFGVDADTQKATQTIYHSRRYPSRIVLPIIPRA